MPPPPMPVSPSAETTIAQPTRIQTVRLTGPSGEFVLKPGSHVVGRQEGVAVFLNDRQVSRKHAIVTVSTSSVMVEDQGSANGTVVNGERLKAPRALQGGDKVKFGDFEFAVSIQLGP
jgi:pSer/pThr/pTyr-binding forkhead associated (FHA) protein